MDHFTTEYWAERNAREVAASKDASQRFADILEDLCEVYGDTNGRAAFRLLAHGWIDRATTEPDPTVYRKGRIPQKLRRQIFERDGYRCQHCGDWHNLAVDHIHPEYHGGTLDPDNLQTLCRTCNVRKGARV